MSLELGHRRVLGEVARESIETGLAASAPLAVAASAHAPALRELRPSFVTLYDGGGELRGCVGGLEPRWPLVCDVAQSAYHAAFCDPRFPPLGPAELVGLEVHISVLSALEPLRVSSRDELLAALRPRIDGLVIELEGRRATFLPAVWESLPEPVRFVEALERKAGLGADAWTRGVECSRYTTESWSAR